MRTNELTGETEPVFNVVHLADKIVRSKDIFLDPGHTVVDLRLNSPGDVLEASTGYQIALDTLTYIVRKVTMQKFYEVEPSDYIPINVGEGAFSMSFLYNLTYVTGGSFESGVVGSASSNARLSTVDVAVAPLTVVNVFWAKALEYSIVDVQQALFYNNWDIIQQKHKSMKTLFDIGIQQIAFLGSRTDPAVQGLVNNSVVNVNLSVITQSISSMDAAEFSTFIADLLAAYVANSGITALPDTFLVPMSDFLGLSAPVSSDFPFNSKLEYLRKSFVEITGNEKFAIKKLAYCDATYNAAYLGGTGKQVYILYRHDEDSFHMRLPQPYTVLQPGTTNNYNWQQVACAQYTGNVFLRPLEQLQFRY